MSENTKKPLHPLSIWLPIFLIITGLVIFWNYQMHTMKQATRERLPMLSRIEKNIVFTERNGETVELKDLKGKVFVTSWVFTKCPRGCPGVVAEMAKIQQKYKNHPDVHFLCISVDPDDTPADLKKFADMFKIEGDNWWFVTGNKEELRLNMTRYFKLAEVQDVPEEDRLTPDDKFVHDMRLVLVDHIGHVRGTYDISNADPAHASFFKEKLEDDIELLLKEKNAS